MGADSTHAILVVLPVAMESPRYISVILVKLFLPF